MKRKERNRERNSTNHHIMRRKKKKIKVMKIRDGPLVHIQKKLDPDTQLDIISRLPFKEAVRCRLVCKSWRILLDDNFLINNHHAKTQLKLSYEYHHASNYSSYSSSSSRLSFISMPTSSSTHSTDTTDHSSDDEDDSDATDSSESSDDEDDSDSSNSSESSDDEDELLLNLPKGVDEEEEEDDSSDDEDDSDATDSSESSSTHSTDTIDSSDDSDATDSSESSDDENDSDATDSSESSDDEDELFLNLPKGGVDDVDIIFGVYDDNMYSYKESRSNYKYSSSSFRNARIISSCNGLICMSKPDSISIYNPITQETLNIHSDNNFTYGFGYHPSTKQYKILRCSHYKYKILRCCTYVFRPYWFEIYTLGTTGDKWRQIKTPKNLHFDYHAPGVHVNGALYWITDYFENKKKTMILSFDLGDDEEFRIITSLPPSHSNNTILQQSSTTHYKLGESQGSLYLIVDHFEHSSEDGDPYIEIWLMMKKEKKRRMPEKTETTKKKYKRDHMHHYSWTKVMKIGTDHHRKGEYEFAGLTKTGKVLFWYNHVLTCFDQKTERFESLSSSSDAYPRTFVPHVNSLVSLKAFVPGATTTGERST